MAGLCPLRVVRHAALDGGLGGGVGEGSDFPRPEHLDEGGKVPFMRNGAAILFRT